nr:ATP-dependent DNA helicase PIF1-like [Tanacetum cinerariifolium]
MEGYNRLIYDERDYKKPELITQHQELYESLTDEQRGIYETIVGACDNNKGGMFFVYAFGGSELIREAKLIIWDDAPMITRLAYEALDRTLRDICTDTYTTNSNKHCTVLKLTKNVRLRVGCSPEDAEEINDFKDWILNIREGIGGKNDGHAPVEFPEEMLIPDSDDQIESLTIEMYDNWQHNPWDPTYFQERSILAHTHEQVDKINERMLAKLPGKEKACYSSYSVSDVDIDFNFNESLYTTELLNTIKMSGIPHHKS